MEEITATMQKLSHYVKPGDLITFHTQSLKLKTASKLSKILVKKLKGKFSTKTANDTVFIYLCSIENTPIFLCEGDLTQIPSACDLFWTFSVESV